MLNLLIKPIWVFIENMVQNEIGHEQYGTYASLFSLVLVFSVLADWGINNYSTQEIAQDQSKFETIFNSLFFVRLFILVSFPILMVAVGWFLGYKNEELQLLAIIALTQTFIYFLMFFRAKFQAFQKFKIDGFISVLERVILIIIILFLFNEELELTHFINARLIAIIVTVLISFGLLTRQHGLVKLKLSIKDIKETLKAAFPFTLITLLYSFNERIDMVMIERLYSKHEAGIYAGAYRMYDALMMFVWLIMPIFFSKFAKAKGEKKGASSLFNTGFLVVSIPMLLITPFLFFDGSVLFFLFKNSSVLEVFNMNRLFQLLIISFIFNAFFVVKGTFLNASGYVKKVNNVIILSAIVNVTLNYLFIPQYGAFAAGVSTAISTGILGIGYFILVLLSRLRIDLKNLLGVFTSFIISLSIYYYAKQYADTIWISISLSSLSFLLSLQLFGIPIKLRRSSV